MDFRKIVFKETAIVGIGELICSAIMVALICVFGAFSLRVVFSALTGAALMTANYFFMAVTVSLAADRAKKGEVTQAKKMVQLSSVVRLLCMGVILLAGIKLGAHVIALVLPLAFARPILVLAEFFRKKDD